MCVFGYWIYLSPPGILSMECSPDSELLCYSCQWFEDLGGWLLFLHTRREVFASLFVTIS